MITETDREIQAIAAKNALIIADLLQNNAIHTTAYQAVDILFQANKRLMSQAYESRERRHDAFMGQRLMVEAGWRIDSSLRWNVPILAALKANAAALEAILKR